MPQSNLLLKSLLLALVASGLFCCESPTKSQLPLGTFQRSNNNGEWSGTLLIHPSNDTSGLIYLEVNRGAPSYNSGTFYGYFKINSDYSAIASFRNEYLDCEFELQIADRQIEITTLKDGCGFGFGVVADGRYELKDSSRPEFFETTEGTQVFFGETSPEAFYQ